MEQKKICALTKQWIGELVNLGATQNILPLLSPDNVNASEQGITLKNKNAQGVNLYLYPGYSAPEVYTGQAGEASKVYFVGAVMYALQTGTVAPDAQARLQTGAPLLSGADALANVINRATIPNAAMRVATLQQLWQEVDAAEKTLTAAAPVAPGATVTPVVAPQEVAAAVPQAVQAAAPSVAAGTAETMKDTTEEVKDAVADAAAETPKKTTRGKKKQEEPAVEEPKTEPVTAEAKMEPVPATEEMKENPVVVVPEKEASAVREASKAEPAPLATPAPAAPATASTPTAYAPQMATAAAPGQPPVQTAVPAGYTQGQYGQPTAYGMQQPATAPPAKKKKPKKGLLIAAIIVVVLLVAGVVYTLVQSNRIDQAYASGDYATVVSTADMTPWLKGSKQQMYDYARAQLLLQEGNLEESLEIFEGLGDYENSPRIVQTIKYDLANKLLDEGKINEALALFKEIRGYQDTNSIISDIELYLSAEETESALEKYDIYMSLGDFLDSAEKAEALGSEVYEEAIERYKAGDFSTAGTYFTALGDYENAALYAEACSIYDAASLSGGNSSYLARLRELSQTIDVGGILTSNKFFTDWLIGTWYTSSGSMFQMKANSFIFTLMNGGGSYYFRNSAMYDSNYNLIATFTYVSYNEMIITMASGAEHHFTRS